MSINDFANLYYIYTILGFLSVVVLRGFFSIFFYSRYDK